MGGKEHKLWGFVFVIQKTLEQVKMLTLGQGTVLLTEIFFKASERNKGRVRNSEKNIKSERASKRERERERERI